jgi:hypothetical protein
MIRRKLILGCAIAVSSFFVGHISQVWATQDETCVPGAGSGCNTPCSTGHDGDSKVIGYLSISSCGDKGSGCNPVPVSCGVLYLYTSRDGSCTGNITDSGATSSIGC